MSSHTTSGLRVTLVLGGGGLKGLAHIGVFRALEERGVSVALTIGTSMGALIAGAWASGMPIREMEARARLVRRRHVFQVAHVDMALRRMNSPAIYRREPLDELITSLIGDVRFDDLWRPLLVNTVDLHAGRQVFWGMVGRRDARVRDAVYASCALPGMFPPRTIGNRTYVDGAVIENLAVRLAGVLSPDPVIAVNLTAMGTVRTPAETTGFAATYARGLEIVMQSQIEGNLRGWHGPPLLLIEPKVSGVSMFAFNRTGALVAEGRRATLEALDALATPLDRLGGGVHPRRNVKVRVDPELCIGCRLCATRAPAVFRMEGDKAVVIQETHEWGPVPAPYVSDCPTAAIKVETEGLSVSPSPAAPQLRSPGR